MKKSEKEAVAIVIVAVVAMGIVGAWFIGKPAAIHGTYDPPEYDTDSRTYTFEASEVYSASSAGFPQFCVEYVGWPSGFSQGEVAQWETSSAWAMFANDQLPDPYLLLDSGFWMCVDVPAADELGVSPGMRGIVSMKIVKQKPVQDTTTTTITTTTTDGGSACTTEYDPVCGTDGVTYSNACVAEQSGAEIAYEGECVAEGGMDGLLLWLIPAGIVGGGGIWMWRKRK